MFLLEFGDVEVDAAVDVVISVCASPPAVSVVKVSGAVAVDWSTDGDDDVADEGLLPIAPTEVFPLIEKRSLDALQHGWPPDSSGRLPSQQKEPGSHSRIASLPIAVLSVHCVIMSVQTTECG